MRIAAVRTFRKEFKLSSPSIIAYESIETAPNVITRIELDNGLIGWGNSAPDEHVTGETAESVERAINETLGPALIGNDPLRIEAIWSRLREMAPREPAAIAAIDIALYHLLGVTANLPLYRLLGRAREEIETFVTLSIEDVSVNIERALDFKSRGFKALKIKCGLSADQDVDRVRAIRRAVGSKIRISLDANQGYSAAETLRVVDAVKDCDIAFIEQPVDAADVEAMREVCRRSTIPVMADESALDAKDVLKTPAPLVNIKLMKTGGVTGALKCNAVAEARGIRAMIGCMDESRISMAAAAHLALALNNVAFADLDGHLDIVDDAASGGVEIENGMCSVSELRCEAAGTIPPV